MKQPGINRSRKISTQSSWLPETYRSDCRTCLYIMMENYKHTTVLLDVAVNGLNIRPDGIYIDWTFGRGGHSRLILSQLGEEGRLLAIDRDPRSEERRVGKEGRTWWDGA